MACSILNRKHLSRFSDATLFPASGKTSEGEIGEYNFPPGTVPPMVMPFDPTANVPLVLLSVSSPQMSEKELYDVAYFSLRNRLQGITGVIAPAVYGGKLRRILAYVDPERLRELNLCPLDVVDALNRNNVLIPTGNLRVENLSWAPARWFGRC